MHIICEVTGVQSLDPGKGLEAPCHFNIQKQICCHQEVHRGACARSPAVKVAAVATTGFLLRPSKLHS